VDGRARHVDGMRGHQCLLGVVLTGSRDGRRRPVAGDLIHGTFRYLHHTNAAIAEKA
jgi:hypothetical protein